MENTQNVTGRVLQQPTTCTVEVQVSKDQLKKSFDDYWDEVKDLLNPELVKKASKGGFREIKRERVVKVAGGVKEFYRDVLIKFVADYVATQEKQALAYDSVNFNETETGAVVSASVYIEPDITWKTMPGVDAPIKVVLPKVPDDLISKVVEDEFKRAQANHTVLVPVTDDSPLVVNQVALIDLQSVIDGEVWAEGTFTNNKWTFDKTTTQFKIPEVYDNVLGMKTGETKVFTATLNELFGERNGKTVELTVRLNQIYNQDVPAIDMDLAVTCGKESLEAWTKELTSKYETMLEQERNSVKTQKVLSQVVNPEVVDVGPVPNVWLVQKARSIYAEHRRMVRTEEELVARFAEATLFNGAKVQTKEDLLTFFAGKAAEMLVTDLVLRSWGKKNNVPGDSTLINVATYSAAVRELLVSKAEVVEA